MVEGKIRVLDMDDWVVVYVDNVAIYEGHSINGRELLRLLKIEHEAKFYDPYSTPELEDRIEDLTFNSDDMTDELWEGIPA